MFVQSILETIVDIFDPLVGMGRGISSTELGERTRGASFVDKLFTPFSGKLQNYCCLTRACFCAKSKQVIIGCLKCSAILFSYFPGLE